MRALNSSVVYVGVYAVAEEGERLFQSGIVCVMVGGGMGEFFRASQYVWHLHYWTLCGE